VLAERYPAGVTAAPAPLPKPADLVNKRWWAFGFPSGDLWAFSEGRLAARRVRLGAAGYGVQVRVERGFSGGGLWSPDYQAVVVS